MLFRQGNAPLIVSIPHAGVEIPSEYVGVLRSLWLARKDADWWLPVLYDFAVGLDASIIVAETSRTVIDVNRDPSGVSLYPGQATTGLCPVTTFDGEPLYCDGMEPDDAEIAVRKQKYFDPYHARIGEEIARLRQLHGSVVLYDCHSIRSWIPRLFDGVLPNFNIGTNDDKACDSAITDKVAGICAAVPDMSYVVNGRFKGGYITRHYGDPENGVNAIQMELACRGYMVEPEVVSAEHWPGAYDEKVAAPIKKVLKSILESFVS